MQENIKLDKRFRTLNIIAIILLLVLFTASIMLAVIAPVFTSNGVASAIDVSLPNDGIPNPNLIKNSNFVLNTRGSSSYSSSADSWTKAFDFWQILNADVSYVGDSLNVNFDTSTASEYKRFCSTNDYFYNLLSGKTYTLSVCYFVTEVSGSVSLRLNNAYSSIQNSEYLDSGSSSVLLEESPGVHVSTCTFTLAKTLTQGRVEILAQNNATSHCNINLYWFKLEEGDSFTGYVPDYQNQIEDLQNEVNSQKDTVANYNFSSRFVTPINTPSRQVYFNMNRYPVVPSSKYFKHPTGANWWSYMDYFNMYDVEGSAYGGNFVLTLGWMLYYSPGSPTSDSNYYTAYLVCNGTKIFKYDCSGSSIDSIVYSNPTWLVSSNMSYKSIPVYLYDFSGSSAYFTLEDTSNIIDEQFYGSSWGYSFALQDLNNWKDVSNDVYYNNGYTNGFSAGKESGFSSGKGSGYNEGFSAGKENGYKIGYDEGVASGQDYSFTALFGAVFDVPIQAFKGLFNFEIFGVNMTSFVSSLLALCVIVVIVKICLGGK